MLDFQIQKIVPIFRVNALVNAAYYNLPENYQFSGESHDFWELSYVDRGQVVIRHDDSSYLLKSGEMLFCKPDVFHSVRVWQGKPAAIVNIAFAVEGDLEVFEDKILVLSAEERQCMAAIVREAAQTYVHFDNLPAQIRLDRTRTVPYGSEQIICNRLEELMIYACRSGRNIRVESRLIMAQPQPDNTNMADWIESYLQEHFREKLTLEKVAQAHCISVSKLKRVFREGTGTSVIARLTELRIKEARRMIRSGKHSFSQIAETVGFESIHYFSTVFKKQTGMTPTEYARSIHKE